MLPSHFALGRMDSSICTQSGWQLLAEHSLGFSLQFPDNFEVASLFTSQGSFSVCIKHEFCCPCKEKFLLLLFQISLNIV